MSVIDPFSDDYFMHQALLEAKEAFDQQEIPVGAIVVSKKRIIAKSSNQTERLVDCTAHAEMLAISAAQNYLGSKYLTDCSLYVTLEPCAMCAGAIYWAQLANVYIGARDEGRGFSRLSPPLLHPKTKLHWGIRESECSELIRNFFKKLRE